MNIYIIIRGEYNLERLEILDSTLRDGAQGEGIIFSLQDKINIIKILDDFGVDFIEAGNPASNPRDLEFFESIRNTKTKNSKIVAFGSTRRKEEKVETDEALLKLADCSAEYISLFGKSSLFHVSEIIKTTPSENLSMIEESIAFLKSKGKHIFFDAEHFFDGFKDNEEYASDVIRTAEKAGAERIILCDTNGGTLPDEIAEITKKVKEIISVPIGIHAHNDTGCAEANCFSAVKSGITHIQGTFIGFGERCGNTNLSSAMATLKLKLGYELSEKIDLSRLTKVARHIAEISNITLPDNLAYVGKNAFSHKGGMHIDGVSKNTSSFEHISPSLVGNKRNFLISEIGGRSGILSKIKQIAPELEKDSVEVQSILDILQKMEYRGYQYEAAEASFELLVKNYLGLMDMFFDIVYFKTIGETSDDRQAPASAMIKVRVDSKTQIGADEGDGPVNAIDNAMRSALKVFYPKLEDMRLVDYKVRVVDGNAATAAVVRVLIETTDGEDVWTTVGASTDIIGASVTALADSIRYKLLKDTEKGIR